jgi:hypothetical protein
MLIQTRTLTATHAACRPSRLSTRSTERRWGVFCRCVRMHEHHSPIPARPSVHAPPLEWLILYTHPLARFPRCDGPAYLADPRQNFAPSSVLSYNLLLPDRGRARATPPWVTGWPGSDRYGTVRYGKCWAMGACVRACVRECGMCVHRPGWEWHRDWRLVPPGGRGQWAPTSCMQQPTHPRAHLFCASQISHTGRPKCTAHASAELGFPRAWSRFVSLIGPNRPRLTIGWRAETPGWGQHDAGAARPCQKEEEEEKGNYKDGNSSLRF